MTATREQVAGALRILGALAETIREVGQVPSGTLYAGVMAHLTLDQYQTCIEQLKQAGLVRESNHLLTWIGPKAGEEVSNGSTP